MLGGVEKLETVSFVAQIFSVGLLFFLLWYLLRGVVGNFFQKRTEQIEGDLKYAEDEKTAATLLKEEFEQKVRDIEQEKQSSLEAARKMAADRTKEAEATAKSDAEAMKNRAMKDVELEKERASSEMRQTVVDVSAAMVTKFLERTIDAAVHEQMFNETMAELEELAWHN